VPFIKRITAASIKAVTVHAILSKCLLPDISLPHIIAVVGNNYSAVNTGHFGKNVDKIGIVFLQTDFNVHFNSTASGRFALDCASGYILCKELFGFYFCIGKNRDC
jgi:hypothetical protein